MRREEGLGSKFEQEKIFRVSAARSSGFLVVILLLVLLLVPLLLVVDPMRPQSRG